MRATLSEHAAAAWKDFLTTIEPIRRPLMIAAGVLVLLSPLGPIVVLTQVIPPLWEKLTWLWNNWNTDDILVWAREILAKDILPGVLHTVGDVASAFATSTAWLAGVVGQFSIAMAGVLGVFGASRCLHAVTTYLEGISAQYTRLAAWANSDFDGLGKAMQAVFDALVAVLQPILDFLVRLLIVALNPYLLPIALTGAIWLLCPDRLKGKVIKFVLGLLIAFISGFPALLIGLGPLSSVVKAGVLGFLDHLLNGEGVTDRVRIDASDKIANIMAGGGLEFIAGLAVGVLHGLLDGIIDPFRLLFLLARLVIVAAQVIGRVLAPTVLAIPGATTFVQLAGGGPTTIPESVGARGPPAAGETASSFPPTRRRTRRSRPRSRPRPHRSSWRRAPSPRSTTPRSRRTRAARSRPKARPSAGSPSCSATRGTGSSRDPRRSAR